MPFNPNFTSVTLTPDGLVAEGTSGSPDVDKAKLLARHVVIIQDDGDNPDKVAEGEASTDSDWATEPLAANGITTGPVTAFGSETYFRDDPPSFLTFTWSEPFEIK